MLGAAWMRWQIMGWRRLKSEAINPYYSLMDIVYYCLGFLGDPECEQLHNEFPRQETKKKDTK